MALLFSHFSAGSDIGTKFSQFHYFGGNQGFFITSTIACDRDIFDSQNEVHRHTHTHPDTHRHTRGVCRIHRWEMLLLLLRPSLMIALLQLFWEGRTNERMNE